MFQYCPNRLEQVTHAPHAKAPQTKVESLAQEVTRSGQVRHHFYEVVTRVPRQDSSSAADSALDAADSIVEAESFPHPLAGYISMLISRTTDLETQIEATNLIFVG